MSDLRKAADPYIRPGTVVPVNIETTKILVDLLRQALAQPTWVGLTDDEIAECKIDGGLPHAVNWRLSAKVLQAKLKEKNT
jgi:hypothetical protein